MRNPRRPTRCSGRLRGGAEARDVAGVLRDLGLDQHDVEGRRGASGRGAYGGAWSVVVPPTPAAPQRRGRRRSRGARALVSRRSCARHRPVRAWPHRGALALAPLAAQADPLDLSLHRLSLLQQHPVAKRRGATTTPCGGASRAAAARPEHRRRHHGPALRAVLPRQPALGQPGQRARRSRSLPASGGPGDDARLRGASTSGYEVSVSNLNRGSPTDSTQQYWRRGTEGGTSSQRGHRHPRRTRPRRRQRFVSRLHVRKGLPFGLRARHPGEPHALERHLGHRARPALGAFEGFRHGVGYLPDVAVRGAVNTVVGQSPDEPHRRLRRRGAVQALHPRRPPAPHALPRRSVPDDPRRLRGDRFHPHRSAYAECPRQDHPRTCPTRAPDDPMRSPSGLVGQLQCGGGGRPTSTPGIPGDLNDTRNSGVFSAMRILPRAHDLRASSSSGSTSW
jgi:hypothetical protein